MMTRIETRPERRRAVAADKKRRKKFAKLARIFIDRGTAVFPVTPNRKTPLTENGFKDASADSKQIREWDREFPDANIGIPTGSATGFVVIDLDRKGDVDGIKEFEKLCDQWNIALPETYKVRTRSGGLHLYFRSPKFAGQIRNSASILGEGIDVRAEGGYVVGEGSSINGKKYRRISGSLDDIKLLPKALRLKLLKPSRRRNSNGTGVYKEGERNDSLFRDACAFRASGCSFERTLGLIRSLNLSSCQPPLGDKEVTDTVKSAYRRKNSPRPIDAPETALTDMGAARRLTIKYADRLKYIWELGKYIVRDEGEHWRREDGLEYVFAKESARSLQAEVPKIDDLKTQEAVSKFAIRSQSKVSIEACLKLTQTEPEIAVSINQFDSEPWLLPVANGVVDLATESFRDVSELDYFLNVAPVNYDSNAQCPNWLDFLELVQPRRAMRRYLQKLVGLTLVGSAAQEIFVFLYGPAGTGKSTFTSTIMKMLGDDLAVKVPISTLLARARDGSANELLKFKGARLAVASEVPKKRRFNESMLKDLSSTDLISTRPLFHEAFQFQPTHTLWVYGNHLPRVSASDTGVWRRLSLLPFENVVPKKTVDINFIANKLEPELPGILNWAIEGCLAWQKTGVKQPKRVADATTGYRSDNDVMAEFIEERIVDRAGKKVRANIVYKIYREWAIEQGEKPVTNAAFGQELIEQGIHRGRDARGNFYTDVKVLRHDR